MLVWSLESGVLKEYFDSQTNRRNFLTPDSRLATVGSPKEYFDSQTNPPELSDSRLETRDSRLETRDSRLATVPCSLPSILLRRLHPRDRRQWPDQE
jgi:hypothetical protein